MKPLAGIRIAVTRPAHQSAELARPLEQAGARVHLCPLIRLETNVDAARLDRVVRDLSDYMWIVFTSANGVEHFAHLLSEARVDPEAWRAIRVACVGPATAAAAEQAGFMVTAMPGEHVGAAVAAELRAHGPLQGSKVLIARAAGGGSELPARLRADGALVDDLELYRAVPAAEAGERLKLLVQRGELDLLTFTSGSAITYFVEKVGTPTNIAVAVIGPSTAEVARRFGLRVDIEAHPHTSAGMTNAILDYYAAMRGNRRFDAGE
jgi:uroporphyrinogen III methyltransferase / synthase